MKQIPLTQGKFAIVDDEDFEYLSQFSWQANFRHNTWYANCSIKDRMGIWRTTPMHRLIMGLSIGDIFVVDHIDHDGLNNQKSNLRICTKKENLANRRSKSYSKSKYLGVYFDKYCNLWNAATRGGDGKTKRIGQYKDENFAALAYNLAAEMYYDKFASINIIKLRQNPKNLNFILNTLAKIKTSHKSKYALGERIKLITFIKNKVNAAKQTNR